MKKLPWILALVVLAAVGVWLWKRQTTPLVHVAAATTENAVNAVTGTVKIYADNDLKVQTEQEGRLTEVFVRAGDLLEEGDPIAQQDSLQLEYRLDQERVRHEAATARLALPASRSFDVENLREEVEALQLEVELGQTPKSRLERAQRELEKLEMLLADELIQRRESAGVLEARIKEMELQMSEMRTVAPFAGEVVEVYSIVGNQLGRKANVIRLVSTGRRAEMVLNEEDFNGAAKGQRVIIRLASFGNREFLGRVSSIAATADADEKTRKLFLDILEDEDLLAPGLTGEGLLIKEERADSVVVPRRALRGNRLWVVVDGQIEVREVVPGFLSLNRAEIREGLQEGERVVVEDQDLLSDGQLVRVEE